MIYITQGSVLNHGTL